MLYHMSCPSLSLVRVSVLKSILSDISNPNFSFLSIFIGIEHLFPTLHFQSMSLYLKWVYWQHVHRFLKIHSTALSFKKIFIYLAALRFSCSMWNLVPWPGIKPGLLTLSVESQSLNHLGSSCFIFWWKNLIHLYLIIGGMCLFPFC